VTAEWLSDKVGGTVTSFAMEQIGVGVGLLGRLYRATLTGDGVPASVVAKFPTLDEGARMNVTAPLGFYANEVNFYNEAAPLTPMSTPTVYDASFDGESGDFVLLLEDVGGRQCLDQTVGCTEHAAEIAIDALATMHAHWWNSSFEQIPWVKSYVEPPYPQVIAGMYKQAWPVACEVLGSQMAPHIRDYGDRFADIVPWFLEQASQPPHTFCHGDYRLDNLFFGVDESEPPVTVLDWQISFKGNPGYDLGYFISQSLATDVRRKMQTALVDRYVAAITAAGHELDRDQLDRAYAQTVAYCFVYPIVATGQIEQTNERMLQLCSGMLDRAVAAIEDADALALLPD
jgi:hypothetical protein